MYVIDGGKPGSESVMDGTAVLRQEFERLREKEISDLTWSAFLQLRAREINDELNRCQVEEARKELKSPFFRAKLDGATVGGAMLVCPIQYIAVSGKLQLVYIYIKTTGRFKSISDNMINSFLKDGEKRKGVLRQFFEIGVDQRPFNKFVKDFEPVTLGVMQDDYAKALDLLQRLQDSFSGLLTHDKD